MHRACTIQLLNVIIDWIEREGLAWSPSIECKTGSNFVRTLCDVLWYIDGHYSTFAECNCAIPLVFHQFSGYNRPELSKHRKRKVGAMCADTLRSHSQRLFGNLQGGFWNTNTWVKFKSEVELLAKSLAKYADMLSSKRVAMSLIHSSQQPVRNVGNSMSILYITPRHSPSSDLAQISSAISAADSYVPVDLQEFLPSDRRRRFDRLESLKKGLDVPIVLVTYAPGSNLHWAWHTSDTDISSAPSL